MRHACVITALPFAFALARRGERVPHWRARAPPLVLRSACSGGSPSTYNARRARCPDHGPLRLRGDRIRPLWRALGVRHVPPPLEHRADTGGGVLGNHAGYAADAHFRDPHRVGPRRPDRGLGGLRRTPAVAPASRRDGLLVLLL